MGGLAGLLALGGAPPLLAQEGGAANAAPAPAARGKEKSQLPPLLVEANRLVEETDKTALEIQELRRKIESEEGVERRVLERQEVEKIVHMLEQIGELVDNVLQQERAGLDTKSLRPLVEATLQSLGPKISLRIEADQKALADLRAEREKVEPEARLEFEQKLQRHTEWLDALYSTFYQQTVWLERMGLDAAAQRAQLSDAIEARAERTAGRVQLVMEGLADLKARVSKGADPAGLQDELALLKVRRDVVTTSLGAIIKVMDELGLDDAKYQQLVITSTGEVTIDIFKKGVVLGLIEQWLERAREWVVRSGGALLMKLIVFTAIVAAFWVLGDVARRIVARMIGAKRVRTSQLAQKILLSMVSRAVLGVGVLVALAQLGFHVATLLTGLGIAGFIVGFALQDSLANFAAGMLILSYRPFDVGDTIEAGGVFGRVSDMNLVSTTVLTFDNQTLIVPNGKIWGDVIKNVTDQKRRRVDMKFRASFDEDVDRVLEILADVVAQHDKTLDDPEPLIKLHELNDSWLDFIVRPWVKTEDYWDVYWDLTREVKSRFDSEGIRIPVPQRDVRTHDADAIRSDSTPAARSGPTRTGTG